MNAHQHAFTATLCALVIVGGTVLAAGGGQQPPAAAQPAPEPLRKGHEEPECAPDIRLAQRLQQPDKPGRR